LDAAKRGNVPDPEDIYIEVNPLFRSISESSDHFGLTEEELWSRVIKNGGSIQAIDEVPPFIKSLFRTAHDVTPEWHIRAAAAFQKRVDNGVSKTINLPASATAADVARAYELAYRLGLKGVTVYRDGSRAQQVLTLASVPSRAKRADKDEVLGARSDYYLIKTGYGPLHVHINFDERGPYQIFTNLPPLGTEISALTALIGILLSKYLAEGGDPVRILKHLNSVKGDRLLGLGPKRVDSVAHAVAIALRRHLQDRGWLSGEAGERAEAAMARPPVPVERCPRCRSANVSHESGCAGPTCHDCGYAECS
jgi:ribonucleoside-diphosphate reductase alpha chain